MQHAELVLEIHRDETGEITKIEYLRDGERDESNKDDAAVECAMILDAMRMDMTINYFGDLGDDKEEEGEA